MGCKNKSICKQKSCGCPIPDLSARCVIYDGETLSCIGADIPDNLNNLLKKFDKSICKKLDFNLQKGGLRNIGEGIEFYQGTNELGEREIRTLVSSDNSVIIELNSEEDSVDVRVEPLSIISSDESVDIDESQEGIVDLSVTQAQSDVLESDNSSPSFIRNQNPVKVVSDNYTLTEEDNNYVILTNTTNNSINITIPAQGLPENNYFVGFLQKGDNDTTFSGYDIKPSQFQDVLQGEGHNAAIEIIEGESYLIGALAEI